MNILYIAYSCAPFSGSEDKIGWNVSVKSAETNRVFVITKEEHREVISNYLSGHPIQNINFYFVDIPAIYKKFLKGFFYSGRLNIWHQRVYPVAKQICELHNIDIINQITPLEFRSIGGYEKIPNTKFVCGPLGGGESLPAGLLDYAKGHMLIESIRMAVNRWCRFRLKATGKLESCDHIIYANQETLNFLNGNAVEMSVISDMAIDKDDIQQHEKLVSDKRIFLCAGRLIYRKGHDFLLDALEKLPKDVSYECRIVGDGPELARLKERCKFNIKLKDHVVFTGAIPFLDMNKEYRKADVFIMPSIRETTGAVILEAMSQGLPVITIGRFGGATVLDSESGWLYDGNTRQEYIDGLRDAILDCIRHPEEVERKGRNAVQEVKKYTWDRKVENYNIIYRKLLSES